MWVRLLFEDFHFISNGKEYWSNRFFLESWDNWIGAFSGIAENGFFFSDTSGTIFPSPQEWAPWLVLSGIELAAWPCWRTSQSLCYPHLNFFICLELGFDVKKCTYRYLSLLFNIILFTLFTCVSSWNNSWPENQRENNFSVGQNSFKIYSITADKRWGVTIKCIHF